MRSASSPPSLITLILITALSVVTMNIFLPSLSHIAEYFEADYALVQLAVSGYLGFTGVLQLLIGPLSDRFGRRSVLLVSLSIFCFATVGCLLAPDVGTFLMFRMLQSAVAAGMVLSRAIIRDMYPPDASASIMGYVTMAMAVAPMFAPMFGGLLDEAFGWQASFVVLLLVGLLVIFRVWSDLGETNVSRSTSFAAQLRAYPDLFRSRRFWGYSLTGTFTAGAFFSFLGGAPFVAETVFGLSPSSLGFYMGIIPAGYMFGNFLSGRLAIRLGLTPMMLTGAICSCAGLVLGLVLISTELRDPLVVFGPLFFMGMGNGLTMPSANAGALSVRPHLAGSASGLAGFMAIGGGAALSALSGAVLTEENGPMQLLSIMLVSSLIAVCSALYVRRIDIKDGALVH